MVGWINDGLLAKRMARPSRERNIGPIDSLFISIYNNSKANLNISKYIN